MLLKQNTVIFMHMFILQIQFIAVISHTGYNKFIRSDCDYPFLYNSIVFYYTISMVVLFTDFYYRTYVRHRKQPKVEPLKKLHSNNNGHLKQDKYILQEHDKNEVSQEYANGDNNLRIRHK